MKLRTRLTAMMLTILLAAQLPFSAFADTTAAAADTGGQIVVMNEDGTQQVLTAEDLAGGTSLPENITVQGAESAAGSEGVPENGGAPVSDGLPADSGSASSDESAPAGESEPQPGSGSTASDRIDMDLPLPETTQEDGGQRIDADLPVVGTTGGSDERVDETVPVSGETVERVDETVPINGETDQQEEELPEEDETPMPAVYWNPGPGYSVDPSFLEEADEEDADGSSDSTSDSSSDSMSSDSSIPTSESVPPAGSGSAPVGSSVPTSESTPPAGSGSAPVGSSVPTSGSTPPAGSGSALVDSSVSTSESTPPAGSGSVPLDSSIPASESVLPADSSAEPNETPVDTAPDGAVGAAEPSQQAAEPAEDLQPGILESLNPVQTAHAADALPRQQEAEKGFFARIWDWVSSFFRGIFSWVSAADSVPEGDDANDGRSPLAPVKTFAMAMQRAREVAAELGVPADQVTIYSMNPQELGYGETLEVNADMAVLKPWEGRSYDSDVLFHVNGGTLTLKRVALAPRRLENLEELTAPLVQVFDGAVVLENAVSAYGSFVLDFTEKESAKAWPSEKALLAEKTGEPVMELGQGFEPNSVGYSVYVVDQSAEPRREVIRAPYLTPAQLESYSGSFTLVGETASLWTLEVDEQSDGGQTPRPRMAPAANSLNSESEAQGGGQSPASASLYAVRAAGDIIYWNPGGDIVINGTTYPAGSDVDRTGLAPTAAVKTLAMALETARRNNTNQIVCMQTIEINAQTAATVALEGYIGYDDATKTFQLHGAQIGGVPVVLMNWDQGLPILNVADGYNVTVENAALQGYATGTTQRTGNLLTVGLGATLTLNEYASVVGGSYIQLEFGATQAPNPVMVASTNGTSATIYASGIARAPHFDGTAIVQATDELVASAFSGNKQAAGEALVPYFALAPQNTTPSTEGGQNQIAWSLLQSEVQDMEHRLVLTAAKDYSAIYVDPVRGDDAYDGITCEFPVKTMARALEVLQQAMDTVLPQRAQAASGGASAEDINTIYPLPGVILACSPIEVTTAETWDWSAYSWQDYDGTQITPVLMAHDDAATLEGGAAVHTRPDFVVRVGAGGSLTLGNSVRIGRELRGEQLPTAAVSTLETNVINVVDGGSLTLTGSAELFGKSDAAENLASLYQTYPGTGIVSGVRDAFAWNTSTTVLAATAAEVTLDTAWTGSIHGLSRGVLLCGKDVRMAMHGGVISGNKSNYVGGGVSLYQSAQFTMTGGEIRDNYAAAGAGVLVSGRAVEGGITSKFTMEAGRITGNTIDGDSAGTSTTNMGGAGVQTYYGVFEMGREGGSNADCVISGNRLSRRGSLDSTYVYGVGVGIYYQNSADENAFVMHSGSITENAVDDETSNSIADSVYICGIGVGMYYVYGAVMENGEISGNSVQRFARYSSSSYYPYFYGGGIYICQYYTNSSNPSEVALRNLVVEDNLLNNSGFTSSNYGYFYGGGIYVQVNNQYHTTLLENVRIAGNQAVYNTGSSYGYGGGMYVSNGDRVRLKNVTVENNVSGNGGGLYGTLSWADDLTVQNNTAYGSGGGWYVSSGTSYFTGTGTVVRDGTFTGNTAQSNGGGIYSTSYKTVTFTETAPGLTKITENTAGNGGGLYRAANVAVSVYLDFDSEWNNTATTSGGNIYWTSYSDSLYLLKGTFRGADSVRVMPVTGNYTGKLYLDPQKVKFQAGDGESVMYLNHPNATINLLAAGGSSAPLPVTLNSANFAAGNILFRPANLSMVTAGALTENAAELGGLAVGTAQYPYTALKDASSSSATGEDWSDYITVAGTPIRTQVGALTDEADDTLTNLALIGEGVYLDGVSGDDTNNGLSPGDAVKTWDRAAALLRQYSETPPNETQKTTGFQPIVWVCGTVTFGSGETAITLPQSVVSQTYKDYETAEGRTPERATVRRFASNSKTPMFQLGQGAVVTVTNARIDGNSAALTQATTNADSFRVAAGGTLKVGDGARIFNSYAPNIRVDGGRLEVNQTFTPEQVDSETDEGYGSQISSHSSQVMSNWAAIYLQGSAPQAVFSGNAYVDTKTGSRYLFYLSSADAFVQAMDASKLSSYNMFYRANGAGGSVTLDGSANLNTSNRMLFDQGRTSNQLTFVLNGNSSITCDAASSGIVVQSYTSGRYIYNSSLRFELYDTSSIIGGLWNRTASGDYATNYGPLEIILGREGGDDSPTLQVSSGSGTISAGEGMLYLEMNAKSVLKGGVWFDGLVQDSTMASAALDTYGILMRDQASIQTTGSYAVRMYMRRYSTASYSRLWTASLPFSITLEDNTSISGTSSSFYPFYIGQDTASTTIGTVQSSYMMGDGQTITLRDNASVTGSRYYGAVYVTQSSSVSNWDYDAVFPVSHIVLEGNASIQAAEYSNTNDTYKKMPLVSARKVTLKDNASLSGTGNTAASTTVYGEAASVKAHEVELDGTASVAGPIWLMGQRGADGELGRITLTAPVASTADEGRFKLHLPAAYMGQVVVQPGGTVSDASVYLACFAKLAAEGEANEVDLEGRSPNIILGRQWNVYLSTNGNDANDGSTPERAVRTFRRAKEILTTVEGYGEGSNIIIPDNVTIQNHDKTWSFDEGGVLTNADGEMWQPLVCRMSGVAYTQPLITVSSGAYSTSASYGQTVTAEQAAAPVVFENITLDDGGDEAAFALSGTGYNTFNLSMLYVASGSATREVRLGEGAVLCNLKYDMADNPTGATSLGANWYTGGFAAHVASGQLTLDGGVIEDFQVDNYYHSSSSTSYYSYTQHAAIVSLQGASASLALRGGAIRNNRLDIAYHRSYNSSAGTGILVAAGGAKIEMNGGEFSGNVLAGDTWSYPGYGYGGYSNANQRRTVGVIALTGSGSSMALAGGSITGNENRLGIDVTPSGKNYADVEGILAIGTQGYYYASTSNVYAGCTFTMTGGSITGNTARHGSAFALLNGTATLSGGTIRDNQSTAPIPSGEATGWKAEYCPVFVENVRDTRLNMQGSGCVIDDPIYLGTDRQIVITDQLRQTNRLYEVYVEGKAVSGLANGAGIAGTVVVTPDGDHVLDATPYLHNFHVHAKGMVLDRGREDRQVTTQLGPMNEMNCLVQMKAVFVDGDNGVDADPDNRGYIVLQSGSNGTVFDTIGRSPSNPVKTFDMAKAVGKSKCYAGESDSEHAQHENHYVIYTMGPVYNDLTTDVVIWDDYGNTKKSEWVNTDASNFVFSLEGAAYMARYTAWGLCMGNGLHETGDYNYDTLIKVRANSGVTTLKEITVRGRREIDSTDSNGETLVVADSGATLQVQDGTALERNNVAGSRPSEADPALVEPIDTRGGAIRAEAGANVIMTGGAIDSTCTAITGGSIYLAGAENGRNAGQLTLQNAVNIGGEVYLGGQQGYDAPILVDASFAPTQAVTIGIQGDYNARPVATWTDGTAVTEDMVELFSFSTSITALYEVLPGDTSEPPDGQNDSIVLNLRNILYLDPENGSDANDGQTPESAVKTIGHIYDMFQDAGPVPGILVFVMNPIVIEEDTQMALTNGSLSVGDTTTYLSLFHEGARGDDDDWNQNVTISHTDTEKVIESQLYFKRYVKTSDEVIPEGYDAETNLDELFIVKGQLQLNGVYLDGHSNTTESVLPGQSALGVTAKAPLVRVEATGSAQFLAGEMKDHVVDVDGSPRSYQAGNTLLTNNTNDNLKTKELPGTNHVIEGSSAGIEILSEGTDPTKGASVEQRGKVVLMNTQFINLQLGTTASNQAVIGGSDVYQNGELTVSNNTYFEGSVFLEGNGRDGDTEADRLARQTSRWLGVSAYGSPVAGAFELLVRDAYHNRRMVKYPYSDSNIIPESEISYYVLASEVSRYFTLIDELLAPGQGDDFLGTGENTLWLRVPTAVYIDPVNGSDQGNGQYPETAVKTLEMAFQRMRGLSAKVLYVMNPIPITGFSQIYPTGYSHDGGVVQLPSNQVHLEIRRYVQPDDAGDYETYYKTPSFTDGPLFQVQEHGELVIEGSVLVDGHSEPLLGAHIPPEQKVSTGVAVTAPLIEVQQGGKLELRIDNGTGERATLANNNNTAAPASGQQRIEGGAIYNEGSVALSGGVLKNNKAAAVSSPGITATGSADGIYQAGDLTISDYPQALDGQAVFLASDVNENEAGTDGEVNFTADHIIIMDMRIEDVLNATGKKLTYALDMDNAVAGRQVVSYPGDSEVDPEYASYKLGVTVPAELFLVESENNSSILELQDWQYLDVSVPEEIFLAVHEYHNRDAGAPYGAGAYTKVARADVDGAGYGTPEYTITNNGLHEVRVTVTGLVQNDWQGSESIQLAAGTNELASTKPLLYLALEKSTESAADGNQFTGFAGAVLNKSTGLTAELGTLEPTEHGSFAFTGAANAAFMDKWMDASFPAGSLDTAAARIAHMRTENAAGETSLNKAAAHFKLTYRIELATSRR